LILRAGRERDVVECSTDKTASGVHPAAATGDAAAATGDAAAWAVNAAE
jgi:hypothetical protein